MAKDTGGGKPRKGSGLQRHFGGKMGLRIRIRGGYIVSPRSHSPDNKKSKRVFEVGQRDPVPTANLNGAYKTNMPNNKIRHCRNTHPISESKEWG